MPQPRPALDASPVQELLARLEELRLLFRDSAAEAERLARLPQQVVRQLIQHGLFRLWIPQRYGGFELGLADALRVYEAAAYLDGSTGWAIMIGSGGGLFAAHLEPAVATALFSRPDAVIAGSGAPLGRAQREKGGYRVSGCWHYASGAHYATTFTANCVVMENGATVMGPDGQPLIRAMAFETPQVAILPVWDSTGMRGTGSDDFEVRAAYVPENRSFSLAEGARESGPLYRLPFCVLTQLPITAVTIGIARHALDAFATLARAKKVGVEGSTLATNPVVQNAFGTAHATWQAASSLRDSMVQKAWAASLANRALTPAELAELTAGCALTVLKLRTAVAELLALTGMAAIQTDCELGRAWRDLQAIAAHDAVSPRHLATAGERLLG